MSEITTATITESPAGCTVTCGHCSATHPVSHLCWSAILCLSCRAEVYMTQEGADEARGVRDANQ